MSQLTLNTEAESSYKPTLFVALILPLPVPKQFTYRVPRSFEDQVEEGKRAIVPFGKRKILTGIITAVHQQAPEGYEAKSLIDILDEYPVVSAQQMKLFSWMSTYYLCTEGEVLNVALPSGLKLSSESRLQLNPEFVKEEAPYVFAEEELIVLELLEKEGLLSYAQLCEAFQHQNINKLIKSLLQKDAILLIETVQERYKPKTERYFRLTDSYLDKENLEQLMESLESKTKQMEVLLKYLQEVPVFRNATLNENGLAKKVITDSSLSDSSLKTLVKNEVFEEFDKVISRLSHSELATYEADITLSEAQQQAKDQLNEAFSTKDVSLLQGVTGSGKTEIYLSTIKEVLESGSQALFLLPEIAITTQMINRVKKIFGEQVGVYHSKFSDAERVEVWQGVAEGRINFVIGVRSSVLLPFNNLSLIVVDEEHENSYKQQDPAPRYHARDTAIVLGTIHQAKVLLGSATPSFESYYNAEKGKYGYVALTERYGAGKLPQIQVVKMRKEKAKKQVKDDFSKSFLAVLAEEIAKGNQAIIFQNRRGYAPYLQCETCGWIAECENCSVSLTYHMHQHELRCHYCGYRQKSPAVCLQCESSELKMKGFGTEKLEDDLKQLLPDARIQRMDWDTTRKKFSYQQIIEQFESGETDILIGTQMVTKGLDFDRVSLVGIVDADRIMHYPDFRSHERAFQLMQQVSGRSGRKDDRGKVLIQSYQHDHPLFKYLIDNNYSGFYRSQLQERQSFLYPPFVRIIKTIIKGNDQNLCREAGKHLYTHLLKHLGSTRVLPPHDPIIAKIRNLYHVELWLKLERGIDLNATKGFLQQSVQAIQEEARFRKLRIYFDVDPA